MPNFEERYRSMSDDELLALAEDREDLSIDAREQLLEEVGRRGITVQIPQRDGELVVSDELRDLVVIAKYVNLVQAQLAQSALISAGIHAVLWDDNMVRMDWGAIPAIGGIRLVVDRSEADAAREILDAPTPSAIDENEQQGYENPKCPSCGSTETFLDYSDDPSVEHWRCDSCSHHWTS